MRLLFLFIPLALFSCGTQKGKTPNTTSQTDTVVNFSNHVKLIGQHSKDFGGTSFNPISIFFYDKILFKDSLNEYWLTGYESDQYPKFLHCSDSSYQLLIEVDERPNNDELFRLKISNDGQTQQDRLPLFFWNPTDIDNDGKLELTGTLTNGETIANGDTAFYNPTLVYEFSNNCLTLDSSSTIKLNKGVWSKFYGYYYNDTLLLPFKRNYDLDEIFH
jgi:hypothetical protein